MAEPNPDDPPGNPPNPDEKLEEEEVGVTRPPPTVELNPISDELTTDDELCEATAARDNCAKEEPLRFKFCNEPMPEKTCSNLSVQSVFNLQAKLLTIVTYSYFRTPF